MSMPNRWIALGAVLALTHTAVADSPFTGRPHLGAPISAAEVAAQDWTVFPDGSGLPAGEGDAATGAKLYRERCAACHGPNGMGGAAEELVGREHALTSETPDKTIGNYWPYATTVFDFIRRSMPLDAPGSLDANEVYALTAYLLALDGIVAKDAKFDAQRLAAVRMPNREGFDASYRNR